MAPRAWSNLEGAARPEREGRGQAGREERDGAFEGGGSGRRPGGGGPGKG